MFAIGAMDFIIFALYIVAVLLIGFFAGRNKGAQAEGFFLARGRLPWYAVGFAMVATSISTEQFIGASAKAYEVGLAVIHWEWGVFPSFALLMVVFMPLYFRRRIMTIPEYLERRFSPLARSIFSAMTLASYFIINLAGVLFSGGYLMHQVFGFPVVTCIWLLAVLTGLYTVYGGMSSVAWTETLQSVLLIVGGLFITVTGLMHIPGGFMEAVGTGERAHLFLPIDHPELPWTAILVLMFSTNVWYACTNQFYIQMCLGAKNEWNARMGVVFATFLGILLGLAIEFTGIVGYRLAQIGAMPVPPEPNAVYPYLVRYMVPAGLRGIVYAGVFAAIMSTISALVHSIATLFSIDFYRVYFRPDASDRHLVTVGRATGGILLAAAALWAPVVGTFPTIFDYFQQSWAVMAAPFAVIFTTGALWKRATNRGAIVTMLLGMVLIPLTFWLEKRILPGFNFFNLVGIEFFLLLGVMIAVSLFSSTPDSEQVRTAVWTRDLANLPPEECPKPYSWYKNFWLWWGISVACMITLYIIFW
ncbi:sodium/solute symporter [bacterium]|nr:sodium/solute symporter [bacterium]